MGARLRLKDSFDISGFAPHIRRVLQAMKTYGLIVADNGSDMFITGTSDPRWTGQMGNWNTAFHNQVHASDFEVVQLGWQPTGPPPPPPDADGDGLPNDWETRFGLDPNSGSGSNGATGDPDDDDIPNNVELTNGTHPNGRFTRYFAEGVSNTFFSTRMAAVNPGASVAHVQFRFLRHDGATVTHVADVPARGRITIDPSTYTGAADYSTVIESDVVVVADRTVSWDSSGYGSHAESSVASPSHSGISRKARRRGSSRCSICCRIRTRKQPRPRCGICVLEACRRSRRTTRCRPTAARRFKWPPKTPDSLTRTCRRRSRRTGRSSRSARCI